MMALQRHRPPSVVRLVVWLALLPLIAWAGTAILQPTGAHAQEDDPWGCGTPEDPGPNADEPFCRGRSEQLFVWDSVVHRACDEAETSVYVLRVSNPSDPIPDAVVQVDGETVGSFPIAGDTSPEAVFSVDAFEVDGMPTSVVIAMPDGTPIHDVTEINEARLCLEGRVSSSGARGAWRRVTLPCRPRGAARLIRASDHHVRMAGQPGPWP